jgi:rhomboid protease GluP
MNQTQQQPTSFPKNQNYPTPSAEESRLVRVPIPGVKPVVSYTILGLTIIVYLLQVGTQTLMGTDYPAAYGIKANELILQGQLWRLITPVLLHGSLMHILVNMYALNIFGPGLERHFGHPRFLILYLISGFAGNVVSFVFSPSYSLGSSTAIFGLLGAEGVFLYQNRQLFGSTARRALVNIITVAVINLVIGLSPGIDNWGHVGGLLGGVAFCWLGGPLLKVEGIYPSLTISDSRDAGDMWRAALLVSLVFSLVAGAMFFLQ